MAPKKKGRKPVGMAPIQDKNESIKKCVVCLDVVTVRGKIPVCDHQFCYTCIHEWSKTTNTCPLCKKRFRCITKLSESSPPRVVRISDKDQTEHYHEADDFNPFGFSDDSENDEPNDSLADFIVNDTTFHSSDDENESLISTLTSPPTLRSQWQQRINLRITSTVNRRPRRNQALNLPSSIQVLFSPPVTRNRSRGTQLLLDFETFSSSSPLPSSREQGSVSPFSPIVTRGRSRNNNRIISSNESSLSARDSSPDITELESNIDMPSSDSNITVGSSSSDSLSSNHLSISARSTDPPNSNSQDNTDTDLPLHNPSPSLSRNGPIRPPLSQVSLRPVIKRIKLREFDSINSGGTSTPSSPCASSHSSVNVIEESPVEEEEEEEREKVDTDEDTTQPLSFPSPPLSIARPSLSPSVQVVKDHANSRRSTHSSALPLCPLTTSMSAIKKRAKSRIIRDSTSEDEIIEELPSRRRRRRQIKDSPSKWLSSRKPRGASGGVRRRKRCHGNSKTAGESESDYNPFDL